MPAETPTDDATLLARYAASRSEADFRALVDRYVTAVYSACLRRLGGNTADAEEAAQAVFVILSREAPRLRIRQGNGLLGWLFRVSRHVSLNQIRERRRRSRHEREAAAMRQDPRTEQLWEEARGMLDDLVDRLPGSQRAAIQMHFLGGLTQKQVAQAVGCGESTVQMRVRAGLERLRGFFRGRGLLFTAPVLAVCMAEKALAAAPAGLVGTACSAAAGGTVSAAIPALVGKALQTIFWAKVKLAGAVTACAASALAGVVALGVVLFSGPAAGAPLPPSAPAPAVSRVTLTPGWATFGLSLPKGAAPSAVQVGSLATQTDVKNRWPDGSIRFAVVTCKAPAAGTFDIAAAQAGPQSFTPAVPVVRADFTIGGAVHTAPLPAAPTADLWLSGGQVKEWRSVVTPVNGSTSNPQVRVIYDTRVYRDGQARIDVTVENVLDRPPAADVEYSVSIVANGTPVFSHPSFSHRWLARWRRILGIGLTASSVVHDFESAVQANAIPRFWSGVKDKAVPGMATGFDLMEIANLSPSMCDCGGRGEMGPYPDWTADYLVHQSEGKRRFVLAHGEQAGSWPMHLREPEGGKHAGYGAGRYTSLDERPKFWFENRGEDRPAGSVSVHYNGWGSGRAVPDIAHQPSFAFVPYLITGDRYFMDEMVFWANFCLTATYNHGGAQALLHTNEHRGMAWAIRNLADTAAFVPDGDAVKVYLETKLRNNLTWFDNYANTHQTPLGHVFEYQNVPGEENHTCISLGGGYGQLAWALDRANKLGYAGGAALRDQMSRFVLKLFTSEPDFPREAAMRLWMRVGPKGGNAFYQTMKELAEANPAGPRHYNHWHRLALVIALENKWPGAKEAYEYNWGLGTSGGGWMQLTDHAGWAIIPDTSAK